MVVAEVPALRLNGPEGLVERYMVYDVAFAEAVHVTVIEFADVALAVTDAGEAGGSGRVVADAGGVDNADVPPASDAVIS